MTLQLNENTAFVSGRKDPDETTENFNMQAVNLKMLADKWKAQLLIDVSTPECVQMLFSFENKELLTLFQNRIKEGL